MKHTVEIASSGVTYIPQTGYEEFSLLECSKLIVNLRFGEIYSLRLHGWKVSQSSNQRKAKQKTLV